VSAPVVECLDATKSFGDVVAVDHVSFSLESGEILSILGPSGCGKTTVLRLIAGFETLDEGAIRIQDRPVSTLQGHTAPEHRNVGMVFQEYALFPHLTAGQNISFGLGKLPAQERRRRLAEVLNLVRLTGLEKRYPHELSGGQQQRVALARTLAPRPVTLLLDEPFSNIDATMRSDMRREVESILRDNHITTIFVTHDREAAFAMADRIAVMGDGRLEQIDTPDVLFHSPATPFVARTSGICDFLPGEVRGGRVVTEIGDLPWTPSVDGHPDGTLVDLLVHAQDFQVLPDPQGKCVVVSREFHGDEMVLAVRTPVGATLRCRQHYDSTVPPGAKVTLVPSRATPFFAFKRSDPAR
jgi:iron(III) transport system ATP-binding protein